MSLPYYVLLLKADLSIDDCVDFLNSVTDNGKKSFRNMFVALPFSRLKDMAKQFADSGISFGSASLNSADMGAFTQPIGAKMVKDAHGVFALVGSLDERKIAKPTPSQLENKLKAAHGEKLKALFCILDSDVAEIESQLELLKQSKALEEDTHPMIIFQPQFSQFKEYFPSSDELQTLYDKIHNSLKQVFVEEHEKISLLVALPSDLVGFSTLLEKSPFQGAFFTKSGIYPHAIHHETVKLVHVHAEEDPSIS